jgi:hypothetical protein
MDKMCQFESMSLGEKENSENEIHSNSDLAEPSSQDSAPEDSPSQDSTSMEIPGNLTEEHSGFHLNEADREKGTKKDLEQFLSEINQMADPEAKLQKAIDFMESSLSQGGAPHFKCFWDARNLSLELFKQNISPSVRSVLWAKYSELSKEARRLREILEEQSAFAAEQIEIAIQALETDISNNEEQSKAVTEIESIPKSKTLEPKTQFYSSIQRELNLLNVQASRINALRKELIKTEMRIRTKNKFFQRLSNIGDKVFPRRKDLIKEISQNFIDDIDLFIKENFDSDRMCDSLFFLREEIKALQGLAKVLTLNTHSFTHTRMCLSNCWDKVKVEEKERKKERSHQKSLFKQNYEKVHEEIQSFNQAFSSQQLSTVDANKKIDDIVALMRNTELGRDELKALRDHVAQSRKALYDKIKQEEKDRLSQEEERGRQKRQHLYDIYEEIKAFLSESDRYDAEALIEKRTALMDKIASAPLTKLEKQELEKSLKPLRDIIAEKKEKALLELSEDDRQKLHQLKELLKDKKERRQEIKKQLESYRKSSKGSSGMDFAQALSYNAQIAEEKDRLDKITIGIQEIEDTIDELESKL